MARTESLIRQAGRTRALPAGGPTRTALASGAAVAVLIIFVLSLVGPQFIGNEGGQQASAAPVNMPDVRNQTFGAAIEQLTEHGINVTRVEVIYGPGALNQVVEQTPAPHTPVGPDDEVVLIVRTGR